ncbi:MAG: hypothetical protein K6E53_04610 [Lachnospiraceae bacterium]|nr:hypothetical protein [Lachnospiraceae bacterium]
MLENNKDKVLDDALLDEVNGGLNLNGSAMLGMDLLQRGNPGNAQTTQYDEKKGSRAKLLDNAVVRSSVGSKVVSGGNFDTGAC